MAAMCWGICVAMSLWFWATTLRLPLNGTSKCCRGGMGTAQGRSFFRVVRPLSLGEILVPGVPTSSLCVKACFKIPSGLAPAVRSARSPPTVKTKCIRTAPLRCGSWATCCAPVLLLQQRTQENIEVLLPLLISRKPVHMLERLLSVDAWRPTTVSGSCWQPGYRNLRPRLAPRAEERRKLHGYKLRCYATTQS